MNSMRRNDSDSKSDDIDVSTTNTANSTPKASSMPITDELDRQNVMGQLRALGVEEKYIVRALKLYDQHYREKMHEYNKDIVIEIMYRLSLVQSS